MTEYQSVARETLSKARALLNLTGRLDVNEREASLALLESGITLGRNSTWHLQKEFSAKPGFDDWYKGEQTRLNGILLCRFFRDIRTVLVHHGPAKTTRKISVGIHATAIMRVSMDAVLIKGQPWYRRSPKTLWNDFKHEKLVRQHRRSRADAVRQVPTVERRETTKITETWHFDDPNWSEQSALELVHEYLDILESVIAEAEQQFAETEK